MDGEEGLGSADSPDNVHRTPQQVLNRYYSSNSTPRPESYLEDVETARSIGALSSTKVAGAFNSTGRR